MFKVIIASDGVAQEVAMKAAHDITEEFTHRPWHQTASCSWNGAQLILEVENDFDSNGLATLDEFSDAIAASISESFGSLRIVSVTKSVD
jgi:hypothetical protein